MFGFRLSKRGLRVARPGNEIEPQEVMMERAAFDYDERSADEIRLEVPLSRKLLLALYVSFIVVIAIFTAKALTLQVGSHGELSAAAASNLIQTTPVFADRGVIYDRNMNQLVSNSASFDLICDQRDIPQSQQNKANLVSRLSDLLPNLDQSEIVEILEDTSRHRQLVQRNLSYDQVLLWEARKDDLEGCFVQENVMRDYVDGPIFSHVIGYSAPASREDLEERPDYYAGENIGKMGLEKMYHDILRGNPGSEIIKRTAFGRVIEEHDDIEPKPGKSLVLHMDADLQRSLQNALQASLDRTGAEKASAVAMDPETGGVLAMVSLPSFDNNMFSRGITTDEWKELSEDPLSPMYNKAISGSGYPTGSTIKPIVALAALEEGAVTEDTVIYAPYSLCVPHLYTGEAQCFRDWEYHGNTDVRRAIAESVNPFFYIVGGGHPDYPNVDPVGATKLRSYLEMFGLGDRSGVDIPGEGRGILPDPGPQWRLGDTYHFSIGQGPFALTPLHVNTAFVAVANGGTLYQPKIVKALTDRDRNVVETIKPSVVRDIPVSGSNLQVVRSGMRQTVTNGSATGFLNGLPVTSAAKTGTAQTGRQDARGEDYIYSWTTAFAPYEDPKVVITVVVEDANISQAASLPVVRDVFREYFGGE